MKLYYSKGSCSLAVRIVINELSIPCDYIAVDLAKKLDAAGNDYRKINPKGSVPALWLDDQQLLTENAAIQQYLADTFQGTRLLPAVGEMARYRVLEWLNFIATDLHKSCSPLFNPQLSDDIKESVFKPILINRLKSVDEQLAQSKYLCQDQFTLADAYLFVVVSWLRRFKMDLAEWPSIERYFNELQQRASIKKSLDEEGISFAKHKK